MKKIILFAIFLICACVVKAQNPTGVPQLFNGKWYKFNQFVGIDSALLVGSKDTNWIPRQPSLVFWQNSSSDTAFWYYNGRKWNKMGNFLDTSSLSNRINLRVKYSDTASMLSPYLRKLDTISLSNRINLKADKATTLTINSVTYDLSANRTWTIPTVDTTSLSNRINLKLNISDTASMLSPYQIAINARVKYTDTASMLAPYLRKADTISLSNRINTKLNISDTASMLSVYLRKADTSSLSNRINLKADKATTLTINGTTYDLSANRSWTIPTIDTTSLSNRINLKLNISDTASMLSPYQIAINARVKYTDTASMLSPYLRKLDTASLSNRINLKQNILSLTTTGTSGAATLVGATLNIPQYQGVLTNPVTGTGTINTVAKFTSSSAIGNSNIKDDGSAVSVNTTAGSFGALQVGNYNGNILMNTTNSAAGLIFQNTSSSNKLWDISSFNNDLNINESNISPSVMTLKSGGNVLISNLSGSGTRMVVASSTGVLSTQAISTTDTTSLSNRINTKLNISDTAAMLSPYLKSAVTSVGLSMPSAFTVSNSPVTSTGTLTVAGAGNATQYIRGDGVLATYNPGSGGGGSSQVFYFNGGVASGVGGYQEMSKVANTGASANYSINADGYIASFLTGTGVPNQVSIPAGNWNFEIYMSASSGGGSPSFYVELYKYDGTTFTLISSSSANPEYITNGTSVDLYVTALSVPATTLLSTDRLAVRVYVTHASKTITMHTQNGNLSEVITTFTTGLGSLNGLIANTQYLSTGTTGSDFNISSITDTHTFNLPTASSTKRGALSSADWSTFNGKMNYSDTASLSNRINTKLNISDTASMLSNYQSGINARLKISDTASMLSVYLRKADTSSLSNRINTKQGTITLTTSGTSGAATFSSNTLNIPNYGSALTGYVPYTGATGAVNLGAYDLTVNSLTVGRGGGAINTNTAFGNSTLSSNTTGISNTAIGFLSLYSNTTGIYNTASGDYSLFNNTTGNNNTAIGQGAGYGVGTNANTTGTNNIFIGYQSVGTSATDNNKTWIGNSSTTQTWLGGNLVVNGTTISNATYTYTLPTASGTLALTSQLTSGTVTSVASGLGLTTVGGSAITTSGTLLVDTASASILSRQRAANTYYLASNPNGYNTGTVTSVATGLGLSGGTISTSGTLLVDTSSASILSRQRAANTYQTILSNPITGTGTANYHAKFTGSTTLGNSIIWDNGTNVGIGNTNTSYTLDVTGTGRFTGALTLNAGANSISSGNDLRFYRTDNAIYTQLYDAGSLAANGFILNNTNGEGFHFKNGSTTIMRLPSDNSVLIGVTSQNGTSSKMYARQAADGSFKGFNLVSAATGQFVGSMSIDGVGNLNFSQSYLDAAGSYKGITFTTSGSNALQIFPSGNTLIQTGGTFTDAGYKLDVNGTGRFSSDLLVNSPIVQINSASTNGVRMKFTSTSTNGREYQIGSNFVTGTGEFAIYDFTAAATRFSIASTGAATFNNSVGIGAAPSAWGSSYLGLQVNTGMSLFGYGGTSGELGSNFYYDGANYRRVGADLSNEIAFSGGAMYFRTAATGAANSTITWTTPLTIASTGAATFTGALTTNGAFAVSPASGYATVVTNGPSGTDWIMRVNGVDKHEIYNTGTSFNIYNSTTSSVALSIANSTGAATFSSSVTSNVNDGGPGFNSQPTTTTNSAYNQFLNADGYAYIGKNSSTGGNLAAGSAAYAFVMSTYKSGGTSAPIQFAPNNSIAMTITNGGNVGIGTTSPPDKLTIYQSGIYPSSIGDNIIGAIANDGGVAGTLNQLGFGYSNQSAGNYYPIIIGSVSTSSSGQGKGDFFIATRDATTGTTRPTERMRITSGGQIQIGGTTNTFIDFSGTTCRFYGGGSTNTFGLGAGNTIYYQGDANQLYSTLDNTRALGAASYRYTVVYATTGLINTSDLRQKKNISKSDLGIDFINKLNPVKYNWIKGDTKTHYGLIAQEIESLNINNFGALNIEDDKYGLNYSEFISPLIKAVQELSAQIKDLQTKIQTLENK